MDSIREFESKARFDVADQLILDYRININKIFLVDRLELKESPAMTATEVNARFDLMQRLLGPVFGRLQTDLLDPLIERTFRILLRSGQLPEMPNVVLESKGDFDVDYIGPMARAQKSDSIAMMAQWMSMMTEFAQAYPELSVLPDAESFGRETAKAMDVPATIIRSKEEVKVEVNKKRQDAIEARQMEMLAMGGKATSDLGKGAKQFAEAGMPVNQ